MHTCSTNEGDEARNRFEIVKNTPPGFRSDRKRKGKAKASTQLAVSNRTFSRTSILLTSLFIPFFVRALATESCNSCMEELTAIFLTPFFVFWCLFSFSISTCWCSKNWRATKESSRCSEQRKTGKWTGSPNSGKGTLRIWKWKSEGNGQRERREKDPKKLHRGTKNRRDAQRVIKRTGAEDKNWIRRRRKK